MRILIVGAGSVSGKAAVQAARSLDAFILATTSRSEDVAGCSHTIHGIDLEQSDAVERILADSVLRAAPVDFVVYIPARGEVGMAVEESRPEMVEPSLQYSVRPYLHLHRALKPRRTIALSGFITMEPLMNIYGAMSFTKIAMEKLAVENPSQLQIIRIGMFHSNSVRGIMILAHRRFLRDSSYQPEWRAEWKASGKKFPDFFYGKNYLCEEETYRSFGRGVPFRPTEPSDIEHAFRLAFQGEPAPIINVLGPWIWMEDQMPAIPERIRTRMNYLPKLSLSE